MKILEDDGTDRHFWRCAMNTIFKLGLLVAFLMLAGCATTSLVKLPNEDYAGPVSKVLAWTNGGWFRMKYGGYGYGGACSPEDWETMPQSQLVVLDVKAGRTVSFEHGWSEDVGYGRLSCRIISVFTPKEGTDYVLQPTIAMGNRCELRMTEVRLTRDEGILADPTAPMNDLVLEELSSPRSLRQLSCP